MNFVIASNNQKKAEELERILKPLGISVKTAAELGISLSTLYEKLKKYGIRNER